MDQPLVDTIADRVDVTMDEIVDTSVARYFDQVPAYAASPDPQLRADATAHTYAVFHAVLKTWREGRPAMPEDFEITPEHATRRLRSGVGLPDFLRGFRIGQVTLWEGILRAAEDTKGSEGVALGAATHLMQVIELGSSVAATAYLSAQQLEIAEGDRVRRDLMEDLLAGREIDDGAKRILAAECRIERPTPLIVLAAVPVAPLRPGQKLRSALTTLRAAGGALERGLMVLRQDQIVAVVSVAGDSDVVTAKTVERAQRQAEAQGISLAVGLSTVHQDLTSVPDAFREALIARQALGGAPGVKALSMVSTLDYLVMRDDPTATRLVRPRLREFVERDLARDGVLIQTLLEYVNCDLNAKLAADRLHVHVNTAYYRLERIAERTGCDLRRFGELEELLVAVRLLTGVPEPAD